MSKVVKWGFLSVLAIALLIKLSLWLSVRSIMNDVVDQLSPFMQISYSGITSSFDGRVGVSGLTVKVPMLNDQFSVDHGELKFKSLLSLLRFKESLREGKFPEQMAVSLKGFKVDVHGPLMAQLRQTEDRSPYTALSQVACGRSKTIGTNELLEMGYRTFETDTEFSYLYQPGAKTLAFNMTADTRDMSDYRISLALSNMSDNPGDLRVNPPRVSSVIIEVNDNQYQRKVNSYCAGKLGQTDEQYQQTAIEKFDSNLRSQRIALAPGVLVSVAAYLKDPQSLRLEFNPTEGMAWDGLQFFDAPDVIAMLRPVLLINQQAVNDLAFSWVEPNAAAVPHATELVQAAEVEQKSKTPQYDFVAVASLPEHAGKRLQFITYDGTYYQGILHKVENGKAFLSVQFGSGSAEMFLRLEKIDKVRVLF